MAGPVLEILSGDLAGRSYELDGDVFTIGRKDDCDLVLPKKYISRVHAEVVRENGAFLVRGVSDKNPVVVEGREVDDHHLEDGDEFELGGIRFRFKLKGSGGREPQKRPSARRPVRFDSDEGAVESEDARTSARVSTEKKHDRDASADESTGPPPRDESSDDRPAKSKKVDDESSGSPPERIVFGEESETQAPGGPKSSGSGSGEHKASGGSQDSRASDEKTGAIDVTKLKSDDPFADSGPQKTVEEDPAAKAARERFQKALVITGVLGIVFAAAFLARTFMTKEPPRTFERPEVVVAQGETVQVEEPWATEDPPLYQDQLRTDVTGKTPLQWFGYEPNSLVDVERVIPDKPAVAIFLVTGKFKGETQFFMPLQSENRVRFKVMVTGVSQHEKLITERKKALPQLSIAELKVEVRKRFEGAKALYDARETAGKENYYRLAVHELERAKEALKELSDAIDRKGELDNDLPDLNQKVNGLYPEAKEAFSKQLVFRRSSYEGFVKREQKKEAKAELMNLLRVIADPCDVEFQRMRLILENVWKGKLTENIICIEKQP